MRIEEWQWDDGNLDELAVHGLGRRIVESVLDEQPRFRRNKRKGAASHQMIGPDVNGTLYVVCIVAVPGQPGLWRAITGWRAGSGERTWYKRGATHEP